MRKLLLATTSADKAREIRGILAGVPVELLGLADLPPIEPPEETGATFLNNARLKAFHYAAASGLAAVAEDSGLEIDALDGAPGVHSARYAGATYPEKFARLHAALRARGADRPAARYVCAVVLVVDGLIAFETEGTVEGVIGPEPRGSGGFGYDPIFFYPPFGRTLAEVTEAEKATVSHRGRAFRALRTFLETAGPAPA